MKSNDRYKKMQVSLCITLLSNGANKMHLKLFVNTLTNFENLKYIALGLVIKEWGVCYEPSSSFYSLV